MNILVIGSGGREHALFWKLKESPLTDSIYALPGNPGMGEQIDISATDNEAILKFAKEKEIGLVVVGPEIPLTNGLVDELESAGIRAFGPRANAAELEGSKSFAKDLMKKYGIPTARYEVFTEAEPARAYIRKEGAPIVVKADGLAAGKGVIVAMSEQEALDAIDTIMEDNTFGKAGTRVVIEEFKEHYLNAPYGDLYHLASALNYRVHPYRWPTIGLNIEQIEKANMEYIRAFFQAHYFPANAILALSGGISLDQARSLCDKWFAPIPSPAKAERHLPTEPPRTAYERQEVVRDVPADLLYLSFPMGGRRDKDYVLYDLLSDVLGLGLGARLKRELVMKRNIFSSLDASVDGSLDPGVLSIVGTVAPDKSLAEAEEEVWKELERLKKIPAQELTRVKNLFATDALYSELLSSQRAELLAQYELLGDAQWANQRVAERAVVTPEMLEACAQQTFLRDRARVLYYQAESKE